MSIRRTLSFLAQLSGVRVVDVAGRVAWCFLREADGQRRE